MIDYRAEIIDHNGIRFDYIERVIRLELARSLNTVGSATVEVPLHERLFNVNEEMYVRIYRQDDRGLSRLAGDTYWLLERVDFNIDEQSATFALNDTIKIMDWRVVAYTDGNFYGSKTLQNTLLITPDDTLRLDNMLRDFMRENFGDEALDSERDASAYILIEHDRSQAPYGGQQGSFTTLLQVAQGIVRQSEEQGVPLYFDLTPTLDHRLAFRVWTNLRGDDRSRSTGRVPMIFSPEQANIFGVKLTYDFSLLGNVCYALGGDSGNSRIYEVVKSSRYRDDRPLQRREFTISVDGEGGMNPDYLELQGQGALAGRKPIVKLEAQVRDIQTATFGVDYNYGDKVTANVNGWEFDCVVNAMKVTFEQGIEELDIRLAGTKNL